MLQFWKRVLKIYRPFRNNALVVLGFLLLRELIALSGPYLTGNVFNAITKVLSHQVGMQNTFSEVLRLCALMASIRLLGNYLGSLRERYELKHLDFAVGNHVSELTLRKILSLSIGQHRSQNSGLTMRVVSRGQDAIPQLTSMLLFQVIPITLRMVVATIALLCFRPIVGAVVVGAIVFEAFAVTALNKHFYPEIKKFRDMGHKSGRMNSEIFRNLSLVQSNSQEERVTGDYVRSLSENAAFGRNMWNRFVTWATARTAFSILAEVSVLLVATYQLYTKGGMIGDLVFITMLSNNALSGIEPLRGMHRQYLDLASSIQKYFAIMDVAPAVTEVANPTKIAPFKGRIEFRDVHFAYPNKPYVMLEDEPSPTATNGNGNKSTLRGVSFTIEQGQTVAIVGKSGAGKSTIISMLQRAYDPDSGEVLIDGIDLRLLPLSDYRRAMGVVEQTVALFDHTLRYNILFGLSQDEQDVSEDRLLQIGKIAHLDTFYDRLTDGFETKIGENGVKLSGGERQRVGIARALIKEPAFLIFDEATSNLDALNESLIKASIAEAAKGRTTIIIAHRLSTVVDADTILVVDHGHVIAQGPHTELLKSCELYQNLVRTQMQS